jgi:hypothetical protein
MTVTYAFTAGVLSQIEDRPAPQKGNIVWQLVDMTTDTAYPVGTGYPITATNMGLTSIFAVIILNQGIGGILWRWNNVTSTIMGYKSPAGTNTPFVEIATTDPASAVLRLLVLGR